MAWFALAAILLLLYPLRFLGELRFDFDLKGYVSSNHGHTSDLEDFEQRFGTDFDFFVLTIPWPDGPEKKQRFLESQNLITQIKSFPDVQKVQGLANLTLPVFQAGQWQKKSLLKGPWSHSDVQFWRFREAPWQQNLVSKDGQHLAIWITTTSGISKKKSDLLLFKIRRFLEEQSIQNIKIIGKIRIQEVYFDHLPEQMSWLLIGGGVLIFILLWIAVRHLGLVLFWWLGVSFPSLTLLGIMGWNQIPLNPLSMVIPLVLAVIGLTDLLHLHLAFQSSKEKNALDRWKDSFKISGIPALLTSFTTALGFLSLLFIPVNAVAEFGGWTALGILITGVWVVLVHISACLWIKASFHALPRIPVSLKNPRTRKLILSGSLFLITGIFWLQSDHFLMQELPENHPISQDSKWFEQQFGGIRPFEVTLDAMDWRNQAQMLQLEQAEANLQAHFGTSPLHSVVSALKIIQMGLKGGHPPYFALPKDAIQWQILIKEAERLQFEKELKSQGYLSQDGHYRTTGRIKDLGAQNYLKKLIQWQAKEHPLALNITGSAHQMDLSLSFITQHLALGLGLSMLTISFIFGGLVRSLRLTLLVLMVNLFPLLVVGGIMGWANIPIQISNLLFFSILLGIAVDDSLHILWKAHPLLKKGVSPQKAIEHAIESTHKALGWSTLILLAGFFPLCFSLFSSPQNLGWSMCAGLMAAWWADVHLLPWMVGHFFPSKKASDASNRPDEAAPNRS